jgi:hypothetical protein
VVANYWGYSSTNVALVALLLPYLLPIDIRLGNTPMMHPEIENSIGCSHAIPFDPRSS